MTATERKEPGPTGNPEPANQMAKYGITRHSIDYYDFGGFRYTALKDAIAQAKRTESTTK